MKIVHFEYQAKDLWGILSEETKSILFEPSGSLTYHEFSQVIDMAEKFDASKGSLNQVQFEAVTLKAPVLPTKNILCIGKNYHDHILEFDGSDADVARAKETPIFFSKALSSITDPFSQILLHESVCQWVDYEAELAVVIGKKGINISKDDALDYVFGYTILNDVTSRDLQELHVQWYKGKSLDTHCPIGPWIVTKDELPNPNNLKIQSYINGELRQDANTSLMMHSVKDLIASLSKGMTLNPGDVIATGTPKGVGKGFNPPRYLKTGDYIKLYVEGIGWLENHMA